MPRRSSRSTPSNSYDDDDETESLEEEEATPSRRSRRSARRDLSEQTASKDSSEQQDEPAVSGRSDNESDQDEKTSDLQCPRCHKVYKSAMGLQYHLDKNVCLNAKEKKTVDPKDLVCPKCGRKFTVLHGLQYHLDKKVCEKPKATPKAKPEDFTCPQCQRSFTSAHGLQYHLEKKVCERAKDKPAEPEDLQCPHCGRTFTSAHGKLYHVENRVCRSDKEQQDDSVLEETDTEAEILEETEEEEVEKEEKEEISDEHLSPSKRQKVDGAAGPFICYHCRREFTTVPGLKYHVDNFVCRQDIRPGGPVKKGKRKASEASGNEYKKIRGNIKERTCPDCGRVFTSTLGLNYHFEKKVCQQEKNTLQPFAKLKAGDRFITSFGIVEVVDDSRAAPTAVLPEELKQAQRNYNAFRVRRESSQTQAQVARTAQHLARRQRLADLYERGLCTQQSIFHVCVGQDPRSMTEEDYPVVAISPPMRTDPSAPADSFPDRMVECRQVADERQHFTLPEQMQISPSAPTAAPGMRLFLRRRLLTEIYNPESPVFRCMYCGIYLGTMAGAKYHVRTKVCVTKAEMSKVAKNQQLAKIAQRASRLRKLPKKKQAPAKPLVVKLEEPGGPDEAASSPATLETAESKVIVVPLEEHPELVLRKTELEYRNLRMQQQPVYDGVFDSLGFRRPTFRLVPVEKRKKRTKRTRQQPLLPPPPDAEPGPEPGFSPPPSPVPTVSRVLPPIIDTHVLIAEVEAGRYPSIKRHHGNVQHERSCYMCKSKRTEPLVGCDFCTKCVHMTCMLERFTVKQPEPYDDFLCNHCIQYIQARRARAEKRRFDKYGDQVRKDQEREEEQRRFLAGTVPGSEYECVAAQGRRVNNIVELLKDSQTRLTLCLEAANLNRVRKSILDPSL